MKHKKRTAIISVIFLALILFIINSFTGNPVSNLLAKKAAKEYIDTSYDELNLQIQASR